ncbi:hypothetical protein ACFL2B_02835 [Patescibacteria group bacterium]
MRRREIVESEIEDLSIPEERLSKTKEIVNSTKGTGWEILDKNARPTNENLDATSMGYYPHDDNNLLHFNTEKLTISYGDDKESPEMKLRKDWEMVMDGVFMRPLLKEMNLIQNPEIKLGRGDGSVLGLEAGSQASDLLKCGTLVMECSPLPPDHNKFFKEIGEDNSAESKYARANPDKALIVSMYRDSDNLNFKGRNKEVARSSFLGELKTMLSELEKIGFTTIMCQGSDERRMRVYKKLGMKTLGSGEAQIGFIKDLLRK